jgi:transaldolase
MKIFLDSCDLKEIEELSAIGVVDGITTNPSIIAKSGQNHFDVIKRICELVKTSVSAEVISDDFDGMMKEADELIKIGEQVTIKVPLTFNGLKACKRLSDSGVKVNVTLCFSAAQGLLAAKAGATFVSPFVGRLDDIGENGMTLIEDITYMFGNYPDITTQVLVASVRNPIHVVKAAKLGADVITCPPTLVRQMLNHPLTDKGIEIFKNDWKKHNA